MPTTSETSHLILPEEERTTDGPGSRRLQSLLTEPTPSCYLFLRGSQCRNMVACLLYGKRADPEALENLDTFFGQMADSKDDGDQNYVHLSNAGWELQPRRQGVDVLNEFSLGRET
jgi:hypothetical protein